MFVDGGICLRKLGGFQTMRLETVILGYLSQMIEGLQEKSGKLEKVLG